MSFRHTLFFAAIALLGPSLAAQSQPERLFDGKTLTGWQGNPDLFRVEEGAIVGGTLAKRVPRNEFLCTLKEYADFVSTTSRSSVRNG